MLALRLALFILYLVGAASYCGRNIRWTKQVDLENVFGIWFGVNYAQHTPDLTDRPGKVGCVTLYISDVTHEVLEDWVGYDGLIFRRNWTNPKWRSPHHNPWSNTPMSGSWLDVRLRHKRQSFTQHLITRKKRNSDDGVRRIRVLWDENGQTEEQTYVTTNKTMGFWKLEQWRMGERELLSRGLDVWYPNEPSHHEEYIYIIESSPETLTMYHCYRQYGGRSFSLVLRRSPTPYYLSDWLESQSLFVYHHLPIAVRHSAICAGCWNQVCVEVLLIGMAVILVSNNKICRI